MKVRGSLVLALLAFVVAVLAVGPVMAQDPAKVAPDIYKCIFENDRVRVCEVHVKPGDKIGMHSHPDHFVYVQAGGMVKFTNADGKTQEVEMKKGEVIWSPAVTHSSENIGKTDIHLYVVQLK